MTASRPLILPPELAILGTDLEEKTNGTASLTWGSNEFSGKEGEAAHHKTSRYTKVAFVQRRLNEGRGEKG